MPGHAAQPAWITETFAALNTLRVLPEEAKALQLAVAHGRIGIGLRNPTDTERRDVVAMVLNQGQLSEWAQDLDPGALLDQMQELILSDPNEMVARAAEPNQPVGLFAEPSAQVQPAQSPGGMQVMSPVPRTRRTNWKVTFYEGQKPPQEINFSSEQETDK